MRVWIWLCCVVVFCAACDGIEKFGTYDQYTHLTSDPIPIEMPPNANYISEQFGRGGEVDVLPHEGIDIWGKVGTPVIAAARMAVLAIAM